MARKKKQKINREKEGYSPEEFSAAVDEMIEKSAERLRKQLRAAWKKNAAKRRHGIAV